MGGSGSRPLLGLDTPTRRAVFWSYLGLWCALRITVYGSQHSATTPAYSPAALLVFTCLLKLLTAVWMTGAEEYDPCAPRCSGCESVLRQVRGSSDLCLRYLLPAASYAVYDNLLFWNLARLDPVTYGVLMQLRLIATGLVWQAAFGRRFSASQWAGIALITVACVLQKARGAGSHLHPPPPLPPPPHLAGAAPASAAWHNAAAWWGLAGVALQIACGVFSSVYNEKMLKRGDISLNLQNVYMYSHSVLCNFLLLAASGHLSSAFTLRSLVGLLSPWVLAAAALMSAIGIVTSFFLKHLDSVTKTVASALELFGDAALAWAFFGIPVTPATFAALLLTTVGIVLYSAQQMGRVEEPAPHRPSIGVSMAGRASSPTQGRQGKVVAV